MAHNTLAEVKTRLMQRDDFQAAYEAEARKERLQALLAEWRSHAGLKSADVAARMSIAPSTLPRMEKNITSASFENLSEFAGACGVKTATLFFSLYLGFLFLFTVAHDDFSFGSVVGYIGCIIVTFSLHNR